MNAERYNNYYYYCIVTLTFHNLFLYVSIINLEFFIVNAKTAIDCKHIGAPKHVSGLAIALPKSEPPLNTAQAPLIISAERFTVQIVSNLFKASINIFNNNSVKYVEHNASHRWRHLCSIFNHYSYT